MPAERIGKAQRWLDLIACLLGRRTPMTVEEIFRAVPAYRAGLDMDADAGPDGDPNPESVRRMFERDKEELRTLGIPIDTEQFLVNYGAELVEGYRLRPGAFYLPYVRIVEASGAATPRPEPGAGRRNDGPVFTREELEVALDALRETADIPGHPFAAAARSAFRKLSFDLGDVPEGPPLLRAVPPGAAELGATLRHLGDALLRRKRVEFRYHGLARGEPTDRSVAPYGLLMERGTWYLVGRDELRDAVRMFHVGRMDTPRVNRSSPASPDFEIPEDFALADYRNRDAWELGGEDETIVVRVCFVHPVSVWADRNGYGELEAEEGGDAVRRFDVRHVPPFLGWILGLGGDARILEPPELADELAALARRIGAAHA